MAVNNVANVEGNWPELVAPVSEVFENMCSLSLRSA